MKILILGAGKMGTFITDVLCIQHEVALFDTDPKRLRFVFNTLRMTQYEEVQEFEPELVTVDPQKALAALEGAYSGVEIDTAIENNVVLPLVNPIIFTGREVVYFEASTDINNTKVSLRFSGDEIDS